MIITLEEVKNYVRVDGENDDILLDTLTKAAENYLLNATGKTFDHTNELAKLLCLVLVSDWYENRQMIGKDENVRHTIKSILLQLEFGSDE